MEANWVAASKLQEDEAKMGEVDESARLLSADVRSDLADILGLDDLELGPERETMFRDVTRTLSIFPRVKEIMDGAPRGSRRLKSLAAIRTRATDLLARLVDQQDAALGDVAVSGFHPVEDRDVLVEKLVRLIDATEAAERGLRERERGHPSRHGPPALARKRLVRRLVEIFDRYYRDQDDGLRAKKLAVDFVAIVLRAAGIHMALEYDTAARSRLVREITALRPAGTSSSQ
jgi:hypothetical protein